MFCSKCGKQIEDSSKFCVFCGTRFADVPQQQSPPQYQQANMNDSGLVSEYQTQQQPRGQTIIVNSQESNGVGVAGFVLAIIALFLGCIPVLGWILWFLGLLLSFIGVFKEPRGLAIAGLIVSLIGIILILTIFGSILAAAGSF